MSPHNQKIMNPKTYKLKTKSTQPKNSSTYKLKSSITQ